MEKLATDDRTANSGAGVHTLNRPFDIKSFFLNDAGSFQTVSKSTGSLRYLRDTEQEKGEK